VSAQTAQFRNGFGINQDFHDYNVKLLDNKLTSFDSSLSQSIRVSYNRYLSKTWGLAAGLTNGFLLNQTEENRLIRKSYIIGTDVDLMMKLNNGTFFKPEARLAPYFLFGYNFNYLTAYKNLDLNPLIISNEYGFGFNIRLGQRSNLNVLAALDQQLNGDFDTHMQYRLGFSQAIGKKDTEAPVSPGGIKDYDNDGIADAEDLCPTVAGSGADNGCPEGYVDQATWRDSIERKLAALDTTLLALQNEIAGLSEHRVVEVKYPGEPIAQADQPKGKEDKPVITAQKDPDTNDVQKGDKGTEDTPLVKTEPVKDEPKTGDKPLVKSEPKQDDPTKDDKSIIKSDPKTTPDKPVATEGTRRAPEYKKPEHDKAYYVVAISTKDKKIAEHSANLIARDYSLVRILPQPNGFYRVGIYSGKSKQHALQLLDYARKNGIPSGWIAYE
jgi:cell division protein FtsN